MTQPKTMWRDPAERTLPGAARRGDEFGVDVQRALAALRQNHGHGNASCEAEGNRPDEIERLRGELQELLPGVNRRGFMQLTGAAAVFAMAGCYQSHPDTIVPYAQQPEGATIGKAIYYSSTLRDSGRPVGVMVKTYDGRPIKIEGNPDHPLSRGRCDLRTQAALLNLYDPDRLQHGPRKGEDAIGWTELDAAVGAALKSGRIGLITGPIDGPANRQLIDDLKAAFGERLTHAVLDTVSDDNALTRGQALVQRVDRAAVLVTLGSDFLGGSGASLAELVEFGDFRRLRGQGAEADLGQVIAFEATLSQTGACADVRVRVAPDRIPWVGWGIAEIVAKALGQMLPAGIAESLAKARGGKRIGEALGLRPVDGVDAIEFAAQRLLAVKQAGKHSLIYVGGLSEGARGDDATAYAAAHFLNAILGNDGVTVESSSVEGALAAGSATSAHALLESCARGEIATLIVSEVNPAYALAASPELLQAFTKVKTLVALADRLHETAKLAQLVAPTLHGLESWGDAEARAGILSLQQPCIQPLWDCRGAQESLIAFAVAAGVAPAAFRQPVAKADPELLTAASRKPLWQPAVFGLQSWQNYVRGVWTGRIKSRAKSLADERAFWNGALARGAISVPVAAKPLAAYVPPKGLSLQSYRADGALALVISPSRVMGDGTWLNNAWLQETSDPVSKITWDNYLAMSPVDAGQKGIAEHDVVRLSLGGASVKLPVHIQEGQHPGTLETFSGWGRAKDRAGAVANLGIENGYSVNVMTLIRDDNWEKAPVAIEKTGETYQLACTQGHNRMEGRDIALDDTLDLHRVDPGKRRRSKKRELWERGTDGKDGGRLSLYGSEHEYLGHKWGMAVDLTTCIGCNACVVACTAENNVPVVGRDEVRKQREMHWMRIDRYYVSAGDDSDMLDVDVIQQPVMCQQCGHAPCEEVCPAMATMHNDEGINVMVYNRCIGTRYCSNNCPYKVRRFNWYEYSKYRAGPIGSGEPLKRVAKNLRTDGATSSQAELAQHPLQMLLNPEVTVRSRGVMEKCNFCVQRTREVRELEKATNTRVRDGKVTSACAQTCPTQAITFGDLNDPESAVSKLTAEIHGYKLLDEELNTRPAVTYLAKVRNRAASAAEREAFAVHDGAPAAGAKEGAHP